MNRPPRRPGLSPEQEQRRAEWQRYAAEETARRQAASAARRAAEAERQRRLAQEQKARRAEMRRLFLNRLVLYLIMLALLLTAGGTIFWISLHKTDREERPSSYTYTLGPTGDESGVKPVTQTLPYLEAVQDDVLYLSMTALSDLLSLTVTGTPDVQKFTAPSGEYVRFTVGSATAEVNGEPFTLSAAVRLRSENGSETLWIPADFAADWMQGVTVTLDAAAGRVDILPKEGEAVGFLLKGSAPAEPIDEAAEFGDTPAVDFTADLSAYEAYMNPIDRDAYLTLINVENKLAADYVPPDLVNIADTRKDGRATQKLREYAAKALEAFFIEMRACGITDVSVTSGYRAYSYQQQLFEQRVAMYPSLSRAEAEARAATVVAIPGSSEHQSGLCIDMHNIAAADVSFANTAAFEWMSANAHKFGFILRFPEDKVDVTGISYEPWHYRFVGRYHATRIYESGLCLEEYVAKEQK